MKAIKEQRNGTGARWYWLSCKYVDVECGCRDCGMGAEKDLLFLKGGRKSAKTIQCIMSSFI